jgi:hypothetical protein
MIQIGRSRRILSGGDLKSAALPRGLAREVGVLT